MQKNFLQWLQVSHQKAHQSLETLKSQAKSSKKPVRSSNAFLLPRESLSVFTLNVPKNTVFSSKKMTHMADFYEKYL
jgi:hypothetical protein